MPDGIDTIDSDDNGALSRAISDQWHRLTRLCKEASETARDYQDTGRVRKLLARIENQCARIDRMTGQDPNVIDAEVIDADDDMAAIPAAYCSQRCAGQAVMTTLYDASLSATLNGGRQPELRACH